MTLEEYHKVIGWQAAGKLDVTCDKGKHWIPWDTLNGADPPHCSRSFDQFRERPPEPVMPDEIFIPSITLTVPFRITAYHSGQDCEDNYGEPVRYIRAVAVIPGERLQWRICGVQMEWEDKSSSRIEYRFKP